MCNEAFIVPILIIFIHTSSLEFSHWLMTLIKRSFKWNSSAFVWMKFERFSVNIRFFGDHHAILCMEQSRKSVKLDLWFKLKFGSWCHVFMLFSSPGFWLLNENKNGSLKTNLPRNISFLPSRSNPYILS